MWLRDATVSWGLSYSTALLEALDQVCSVVGVSVRLQTPAAASTVHVFSGIAHFEASANQYECEGAYDLFNLGGWV